MYNIPVADPGFPVGGRRPLGGGGADSQGGNFENFVCQNERIWTLGARPLHPPMHTMQNIVQFPEQSKIFVHNELGRIKMTEDVYNFILHNLNKFLELPNYSGS